MLAPSVAPFDTEASGFASVVRGAAPIRATASSAHGSCDSFMLRRATAIATGRPYTRAFQPDALISIPRFAIRARACPLNVIRIVIYSPVVGLNARRVG